MDRWVEAADWIVWQLCGNYVRNACTAGYKGIYQDGRYPSEDTASRVAQTDDEERLGRHDQPSR